MRPSGPAPPARGVRDEGRPARPVDEHDRDFKVERARGFLTEGHPVRLVVRFLGRDMRHPEVGMKALQDALEVLGNKVPINVVQQPRMEGRSSPPSSTSPRAKLPEKGAPSGPTASPSIPINRRPRGAPQGRRSGRGRGRVPVAVSEPVPAAS